MAEPISTAQVARQIGISKGTLLRWLREGKFPEPKRHTAAGVDFRLWSARNVEHVRKYKELNYRKGRGRKPKP